MIPSFMRRPIVWLLIIVMLQFAAITNAAEVFRFYQKRISLPEMGEVPGCALIWRAEEYSFLPPRNWRVSILPAEQQVTMESPGTEGAITIELLEPGRSPASKPGSDAFREEVLRQFVNATIKEEFICYTGESPGKGFEVEWLASNKYPMCCRIAFVPLSGGTLKFVLRTTPAALAVCQQSFGGMLTSFHRDKGNPGK